MRLVIKYGGTSVGSTLSESDTLEKVNRIVLRTKKFLEKGHQVIIVVSALSGETNKITNLLKNFETNELEMFREKDAALSSGETLSASLVASALLSGGIDAQSFNAYQAKILTNSNHNEARILGIDTVNIRDCLDKGYTPVISGFQGITRDGDITTLGRGGSDTTAIALAIALGAKECYIFTDVDGIYSADPRIIKTAKRIEELTPGEALGIAQNGGKVLHEIGAELIRENSLNGKDINFTIASSKEDPNSKVKGTRITNFVKMEQRPSVVCVTQNKGIARITAIGVHNVPGQAGKVLGIIPKDIPINLIVQGNSKEGLAEVDLTIKADDLKKAIKAMNVNKKELGIKIENEGSLAEVSVIGSGMDTRGGVAQKVFKTIGDLGINIKMISTSDIKIIMVIEDRDDNANKAVEALHKVFCE